jgi:anti-anti-sigma factor
MPIAITVPVPKPVSAGTVDYGGARIRAHSRHLATVLTIRGEIDGLNADEIGEYTRRFVFEKTHLVLDMSDVSDFSPAGISLLQVVDEHCRAAGVEWTLVASPAVVELLGNEAEPMFPTARSVPAALCNVADAIVRRRQLVLPLVRKTA